MERAPVRAPLIKNLEFKVGLLMVLTGIIALAFLIYVLHARGAFEDSQALVLTADNADGVSIGMPVTFSGFPIGQVRRMTLTDEGQVRLTVDVPEKNLRWLRSTSVFTLEKPLVGGAKIRAYTANLQDPALVPDAEIPLHTGDTSQEIPVIVAKVRAILENVQAMTQSGSSIDQTLTHVSTITGRMSGPYGLMEGVLGDGEKARKLVDTIDHANTVLKSVNGISLRVDGMLGKTEQRLFAEGGAMDEVQQSLAQINVLLREAQGSLKKADAILGNAEAISADVKGATTDIGTLRAEVDDSLNKVNHLINDINRIWPFKGEGELTLP